MLLSESRRQIFFEENDCLYVVKIAGQIATLRSSDFLEMPPKRLGVKSMRRSGSNHQFRVSERWYVTPDPRLQSRQGKTLTALFGVGYTEISENFCSLKCPEVVPNYAATKLSRSIWPPRVETGGL